MSINNNIDLLNITIKMNIKISYELIIIFKHIILLQPF